MNEDMRLGELIRKLQAAQELLGEDAFVSIYPDSSGGYSYNNRVNGVSSLTVSQQGPSSVTISYSGRP